MSRAIFSAAHIAATTTVLVAAIGVTGVAPVGATFEAGTSRASIHIRGTAYEFNSPNVIAGATVRVLELPRAVTTTLPDGSYDLVVPDGTRVTPYIEAAGYHGIQLQTFVTAGENLERVNFQTPTQGTYEALAALLGVELDDKGDPARCAVVSTFSTVEIRDLSYEQFRAYGAHGVAGATGRSKPALPNPIYFNDQVIPDPSLTQSSEDGGVIWLEVPTGVYRFSGRSPSTRFADFVATCAPGTIVNANPPQGLYELRPDEKRRPGGRGGDRLGALQARGQGQVGAGEDGGGRVRRRRGERQPARQAGRPRGRRRRRRRLRRWRRRARRAGARRREGRQARAGSRAHRRCGQRAGPARERCDPSQPLARKRRRMVRGQVLGDRREQPLAVVGAGVGRALRAS